MSTDSNDMNDIEEIDDRTQEQVDAEAKKRAAFDKKYDETVALMRFLDIPCYYNPGSRIPPSVFGPGLYDILTDETKVQALVAKLRMKAFW
jgi:hypothetical protein